MSYCVKSCFFFTLKNIVEFLAFKWWCSDEQFKKTENKTEVVVGTALLQSNKKLKPRKSGVLRIGKKRRKRVELILSSSNKKPPNNQNPQSSKGLKSYAITEEQLLSFWAKLSVFFLWKWKKNLSCKNNSNNNAWLFFALAALVASSWSLSSYNVN